jgi:anti-anti-sigma regulatory factor
MYSHLDTLLVVQPRGVLGAANAKALQLQLMESIKGAGVGQTHENH